jgi:hypothetical protein
MSSLQSILKKFKSAGFEIDTLKTGALKLIDKKTEKLYKYRGKIDDGIRVVFTVNAETGYIHRYFERLRDPHANKWTVDAASRSTVQQYLSGDKLKNYKGKTFNGNNPSTRGKFIDVRNSEETALIDMLEWLLPRALKYRETFNKNNNMQDYKKARSIVK